MTEARIRPNLESVTIATLPVEAHQYNLITQFNNAVLYDLVLSEYLSQLNSEEKSYSSDFTDALGFTASIIRKGVYCAFVNIMDYGSTTMLKHASDVLELCKRYRVHEVEEIMVGGSPKITFDKVDHFIKDVQGIDYFNTYIRKQ